MVYSPFYAGEWNINSKNIIINQQENDVFLEEVDISDFEKLDNRYVFKNT